MNYFTSVIQVGSAILVQTLLCNMAYRVFYMCVLYLDHHVCSRLGLITVILAHFC